MRLMIMICLLLSFSCIREAQEARIKTFRIQGLAQGTSYQITYYADREIVKKPQIEQLLSAIDSSLSIYKPYSLISRFNHSDKGLRADKHLERVVKKSLEISKETGGAFDITVLPLVQAWGFGTERIAALPDSATIRQLLKCTGNGKIKLQQAYLQKAALCVQIDVNGIAQGYTVDVLAGYLQKKGIQNYLVELGGEIRVKGRKTGGERMKIGIEGPGGDEYKPFPVQTIISLSSGAITTSGNYRKFLRAGTHNISHLIDPETGYPVLNNMVSATVWAKDAITADGYDNALMGMGVQRALEFTEQQKDLEAFIIYKKANGTVADTATTGFYKMMK